MASAPSLAVPMLRGDDVVGVIAVTRTQVGGFTPAEIALLQTFADQAVIAVENARLLTELQAKNASLTEALEQQTATSEILGDLELAHRRAAGVRGHRRQRGPARAAGCSAASIGWTARSWTSWPGTA